MKGCPEPKKSEFLKEIKEFLRRQIQLMQDNMPQMDFRSTEDEKIATLSFVIFDKNKNGAWERKEWKPFRELILPEKYAENYLVFILHYDNTMSVCLFSTFHLWKMILMKNHRTWFTAYPREIQTKHRGGY